MLITIVIGTLVIVGLCFLSYYTGWHVCAKKTNNGWHEAYLMARNLYEKAEQDLRWRDLLTELQTRIRLRRKK